MYFLLKLDVMLSNAPELWSIEQVAQWLESINLTAFVENFKRKIFSFCTLKIKTDPFCDF